MSLIVPSPASPAKVRIGVQTNLASSLCWGAQDVGAFEKQGLQVELVPYPSGKLALQGMLAGEVDLATCADMPIAASIHRGEQVRILGAVALISDGAWIVARTDHGIQRPLDLLGKRVATQKHSAVHYYLSLFLLKHGLDAEEEVAVSFMTADELCDALEQGDIDAYSMRNPYAARSREELGVERIVEFHEPTLYTQHFMLVSTPRWLKQNETVSPRILQAILEAESVSFEEKETAERIFGFEIPDQVQWRKELARHQVRLTLPQSVVMQLEGQLDILTEGEEPGNILDSIELFPLKQIAPQRVGIY